MNKTKRFMKNGVAARTRGQRSASRGFTLIELMIVIAIIFILLGLAAGRYDMTILRSREAVLKHDLLILREAIDNFTLDKQAAPQSLEDLHQAGYLREVPVDPMTQATDWDPVFDNVVMSPDQVTSGMTDVHSHSPLTSRFDGTAYNTW
jgi:general secretion pathway protein G